MAVTGVQQGPSASSFMWHVAHYSILGPGGTFMWPDKTVRVHLNEVQLLVFPPHCRPSPPSDTDISLSYLDVPLTIPKDAK